MAESRAWSRLAAGVIFLLLAAGLSREAMQQRMEHEVE